MANSKEDSIPKKIIDLSLFIENDLIKNNYKPTDLLINTANLIDNLVIIKNINDSFIYANNAFCNLLLHNESYTELIGKTDGYIFSKNRTNKADWFSYGSKNDITSEIATTNIIEEKTYFIFGEKYLFSGYKLPLQNNGIVFGYLYYIGYSKVDYPVKLELNNLLSLQLKIWNNSTACMRIMDENGFILEVNAAFCKLVEKSRDELIGQQYNIVYIDTELTPRQKFTLDSYLPSSRMELTLWNNKQYFLDFSSTVIPYGNDDVVFLSIIKDVTNEKDMLSKLKNAEDKYNEITDLLPINIFENDTKGNITYISKSLKKLLEIPDEISPIGMSSYSFIVPEERELLFSNFNRRLNNQASVSNTYTFLSYKKNQHTVLIYSIPIIENGQSIGVRGIILDITDRVKLEENLRKSEHLYKSIINTSPDGISLLDINGNIIFANDRKAKLFHYQDAREFVGMNAFSLVADDSVELLNKSYFTLLKVGKLDSLELKLKRKDGTIFWGEYRVQIIFDNNNKPFNILSITTDITERKNSEEEKRLNELRLETLLTIDQMKNTPISEIINFVLKESAFQTNSEGAFVAFFDNEERIVSVNSYYKGEYYRDSEITLIDFTEPPLWLKPLTIRDTILYNDFALTYLANEKLPCSDIVITRFMGSPFYDGNNITLIAGVINKKSEYSNLDLKQFTLILNALQKSITQYKNDELIRTFTKAIEQNPSLIIITNPEGVIQYTNPKYTLATGYSAEEVKGLNPRILKSGQNPIEIYTALWNTIKSGKEWSGELLNRKKDGSYFWQQTLISPILNEKGEITNFIGINQDITDKKQFENELIEAKDKAENSERMKSEFLAQMSHEIRTPINAVLSFASLIKFELEDSLTEDLKESFTIIGRAGNRLIRTIDLILNMSELQAGSYDYQLKQIDLINEVLSELVKENSHVAKDKGITLELSFEENDILVNGDIYSVTQIFTNLIDNAIKFTNKGFIRIMITSDNTNIYVAVADSGIGIADEYKPNLFSAFSQEEQGYTRRFEGNGLGLALVKKYCELNNATISLESKKGVGSVFTVAFPK